MLIRKPYNLLRLFFTALLFIAINNLATAAPISRSITISNNTSLVTTFSDWTTSDNSTVATVITDWNTATDVTNNTGQFSLDGRYEDPCPALPDDLDCTSSSVNTGRDLKKFAYSYDLNNLYMYVERYASATNVNDWWFYLDINANGLMEAGEPILNVAWSGASGQTSRQIFTYTPFRSGGDPLTCPTSGANSIADGWCTTADVGDGYDMPGTVVAGATLATIYGGALADSGVDNTGNPLDGVSMETFVAWSDMGKTGPSSLGFHISSSNGTNLPSSLIDNLSGLGTDGGSIAFSELAITKTASSATTVGGDQFSYTIAITNSGDSATSNIEVTDTLDSNLTFVSGVGTNWSCTALAQVVTCTYTGTLVNGGSTSFILTVDTAIVTVDTALSNTADITNQDNAENDTSNNTATENSTILIPAPDLIIDKSHVGNFSEGGTGSYNILVSNQGDGDETGNITVNDTLPAGLTFVSGSGTGWTCGVVGQDITCTNADTLASGSSLNNLQIVVSVDASAVPAVTNTASVTGTTFENVTNNNSDSDPTNVNTATSQMCYAVDGNNNALSLIDTSDFSAASNESNVGFTGVSGIDGIAYDCGNGILYAANNGQIGTLNQTTGAFSALASPAGTSSNGTLGLVAFSDIDGLSYDPATSALYASVNNASTDVLIQINVTTGAFVANAFGAGIDYVAIGSIANITDISVNHSDGNLYGIDGGTNNLLSINKTTGATTAIGALGASNITSLGADGSGGFWGSTSTGAITESVFEVDLSSGAASNARAIDGGGALDGSSYDYDAYDCIANCALQQVDLAISKSVNNATPLVGSNIIYAIQVTNNGPATATTVQLIDNLPTDVTYISDSTSQGSYDTTSGIWFIGTITSGNSATLQITASADTVGTKTNTASISYVTQTDTDNTNDTDSVSITPVSSDLSSSTKVGVDLNGGDPEPGDIIEYTIAINETAGSSTTGVSVTDPLPSDTGNLTIVSIPTGSTDNSTVTLVDITNITVAASGTEYIVFRVTILADTANNTSIDNTATITNPSGPGATPVAVPFIVTGNAEIKTLYLQGTNALTRVQHGVGTQITVAGTSSNTWTLSPTIFSSMTLDSTQSIAIPIWITGTFNGKDANVTLNCTNCAPSSPIGTSTDITIASGGPTRYTFSINFGADVTINAGSNYSLTFNNISNKDMTIHTFNAGAYSQIDLNTTDVIKVNTVTFYDDAYPAGIAITELLPGQTIYIRAEASDPFGAADINAVTLQLIDASGSEQVVTGTAMTEIVSLTTGNTKTYEYQFDVLATDPTGIWSALVTAYEGTEGTVTHTKTATFNVRDLPSLMVLKMVQTFSDPINASNPKAIPGAFMNYTIIVTNSGTGFVDNDSSIVIDPIPTKTDLFVGDLATGSVTATNNNGPVTFTDGATTSTLTYNFDSLSSTTDDVDFSTDGVDYSYIPIADATGFDPAVTHIRINPKGSHAKSIGDNPSYSLVFRVRIQ